MLKNIIFDFGDIFINLDKEATVNALAQLGVSEISEETVRVCQQYEMGMLSTKSFVDFFEAKFQISSEKLIAAWNAILLDFPEHRLLFLQELAKNANYNLFLLSNTNELHISWIQENWGMRLYNTFKNCFGYFYLSHEMRMRKPNANIFEYVLKKHSLVPKETLFIDDTQENIDAAKLLGIQTWNLIPGQDDIIHLFNQKQFSN
ncbi:HAD-IA family hydrolase [Polaribacter sp.]|jgi:FMN phosphatase YigB (HAD superfamily)|nr:HAD-IA family hydrolase [Polaribacter sp.]MDG1246248.1 HAD-IA family hydrolase [Polaribacter sp.]